MSQWTEILSPEQMDERFAETAKLDPAFAKRSRAFWETQSATSLENLRAGSWLANDAEGYQMARSFLANNFGR